MGEGESKTPIPRSSSVGKRLRSLVRKQKSSQEKETGNLKSVIDQYKLRDATSRKDSVSALEFGRAVANAKDADECLSGSAAVCVDRHNDSYILCACALLHVATFFLGKCVLGKCVADSCQHRTTKGADKSKVYKKRWLQQHP